MLKTITTAYGALAFIVLLIEDVNDGVPGAQKKIEATAQFKAMLASALGMYPAWLPDVLVGAAIDLLVNVANTKGWFVRKATGEDVPAVTNAPELPLSGELVGG
jgi:hypothetical protein